MPGMRYDSPKEVMDEIAALTPIYGGITYDRLGRQGLQWPCPDREHPGTPVLHVGSLRAAGGSSAPSTIGHPPSCRTTSIRSSFRPGAATGTSTPAP